MVVLNKTGTLGASKGPKRDLAPLNTKSGKLAFSSNLKVSWERILMNSDPQMMPRVSGRDADIAPIRKPTCSGFTISKGRIERNTRRIRIHMCTDIRYRSFRSNHLHSMLNGIDPPRAMGKAAAIAPGMMILIAPNLGHTHFRDFHRPGCSDAV